MESHEFFFSQLLLLHMQLKKRNRNRGTKNPQIPFLKSSVPYCCTCLIIVLTSEGI